ncbi:diguanylate cyclase [Algibacillus agarilyticus]|uniref:diguanylate cyclase n=1 Tax=Algibacillus agarilyticus TaxID=2234133 RepID=UPI000DCFA9C4|nr:diguanylate cyclase [Algibacillus agarilyticus]
MTSQTSIVGRGFIRRLYGPRIVGCGLGAIAVAAVFDTLGVPWYWWLLLFIHGFVWPHFAYFRARNSFTPYDAELNNLLIDSFLCAFWIPVMQFNLLPSVLIVAWMCFDNLAAAGVKFALRGLVALAIGLIFSAGIVGLTYSIETTVYQIYAALPVLIVYPLSLGYITFYLSKRIYRQKLLLEKNCQTDDLTKLHNRRYWESLVSAEHIKCERHQYKASLMIINIDNFKTINELFGHQAADKALQSVASLLKDNNRKCDILGRYAGDEFAILLTETTQEQAQVVAEKLHEKFNRMVVPSIEEHTMAVAIGIAEFSNQYLEYQQWLNQADQALLQAKQLGKNQTAIV